MRPSFPQASFFSPLRSTFFHLFPRRPSLPSMSSKSGQKTGWEKSKSEPYSMDGRTSLNLLLPPPHNFSSDPAGKPRGDAYPVRVIASSADRVNPGQRRRCRQQRREHACAERIDGAGVNEKAVKIAPRRNGEKSKMGDVTSMRTTDRHDGEQIALLIHLH